MSWTGWDGSQWDLLGNSGGVFLTRDGVRGLASPKVDRFTSMSPALAGSRWRGSRTLEREVFWPLMVFHDNGSAAWQAYDRAFWATMDPDRPGWWSVTNADGSTRTLRCRFVDDGDHQVSADPSQRGWDVYAITLIAEDPWWRGPVVRRSFAPAASRPFFGGVEGGSGPPFYISPGSTLDTAAINNPGDVDAHPVYVVTGPTTRVSVGVGGHLVTFGGVLRDGQSVTIDTRPDRLTVVDGDGADRLRDLTAAEFVAIPAGAQVPLTLDMVGAGTVDVALEPAYRRPW